MFDEEELLSDARARIGTVLCGKYRLDSILGIGGMATVYAATHRNNAELAIKLLHRALGGDPRVRERFVREAYVANKVKHRNVVKIVDDDVAEDGSAFFVMDRVPGAAVEDLRDPETGTLGLHAAVAVVDQLLDVLAAAHAQGVVHRDIKPANLFVTTYGEVKVLDFGIARMHETLTSGLSVTGAATIMGTPSYMAPEQAYPGMSDVDPRTDVWAAGATLFTLISGRPVHEGERAHEVLLRAAVDASRPLETVAPRVPRAIAEVVDCALAFEKAQRWQSARAMRAALLASYRLHFGRSPPRTSVIALLEGRTSGVSATMRISRAELPTNAEAHTEPALPASSSSEEDTLFSRTSIPTAADRASAIPKQRVAPQTAWTLAAVAAIVCAGVIGQRAALMADAVRASASPGDRAASSARSMAGEAPAEVVPAVPDASASADASSLGVDGGATRPPLHP